MNIINHYKSLGEKVNTILESSLQENSIELLSTNHSFLHDFSIWLEVLANRPENIIFQNSIKELQISILSCSLGLYQQAFMGLRFFLERTLVAILFSATEIELNLWKLGERDTYWSELIDKDKGIFSQKFCKAFYPELKDEIKHFNVITQKVYRECSEYVHGNQNILDKIPKNIEYSEELFNEWNTKADIIKRIILFTLCLRYLKHFTKEDIKKVENTISEEFKSINEIVQVINI